MKRHSWLSWLIALIPSLFAQQPADKIPLRSVSSYIDTKDTAYITRVVNVLQTIKLEAHKSLVAPHSAPSQENRERHLRQMLSDAIRALYPVNAEFSTIAGMPVSVVTPPVIPRTVCGSIFTGEDSRLGFFNGIYGDRQSEKD